MFTQKKIDPEVELNSIIGSLPIKIGDKYAILNRTTNTISSNLFDEVFTYEKFDFYKVKVENKYNLVDTNGKFVFKKNYNKIIIHEDNLFEINWEQGWNLIDLKENLLSKKWFDWINSVGNIFQVRLKDKYNFINKQGKLLLDYWVDDVNIYREGNPSDYYGYRSENYSYNGYIRIKYNNKYNFINLDGKLIGNLWFTEACNFMYSMSEVQIHGNDYYGLTLDGKLCNPYSGKIIDSQYINDLNKVKHLFNGLKKENNKNKSEVFKDIAEIFKIYYSLSGCRNINVNTFGNYTSSEGFNISNAILEIYLNESGIMNTIRIKTEESFEILNIDLSKFNFLDILPSENFIMSKINVLYPEEVLKYNGV
ncbi:MAG: hypothetical protein MJ224_06400 [archaeon]|nr:hypothetical protein [archaeon]